jgi:hypothetical protein
LLVPSYSSFKGLDLVSRSFLARAFRASRLLPINLGSLLPLSTILHILIPTGRGLRFPGFREIDSAGSRWAEGLPLPIVLLIDHNTFLLTFLAFMGCSCSGRLISPCSIDIPFHCQEFAAAPAKAGNRTFAHKRSGWHSLWSRSPSTDAGN